MRRSPAFFCSLLTTIGFFALYASTAASLPTGYADSDELLVTGYLFGAAHPPGYSLIVLLIGLWQHALFWLSPAHAGNLLAAASQSLILGLLVLINYRLLAAITAPFSRMLAFLPSLLLGLSGLFWFHSTRIEVQTLQNLLLTLAFYTGLVWWQKSPQDSHRPRYFYLTCLFAGLAFSQVQTAVLTFPALGLLSFFGLKKIPRPALFRPILKGFGVFLIALLLPALLLYWLNSRKAEVSWRFPQSPSGLLFMLTRKDYSGYFIDEGRTRSAYIATLSSQLLTTQPHYLALLIRHLGYGYLGLSLLGLIYLWRRQPGTALILSTLFICTGPLFIGYMGMNPDPGNIEYRLSLGILERQLLLSEIVLLPAVAVALLLLARKLPRPGLLTGLVVIIALSQVIAYSPKDWRPYDRLVSTYTRTLLDSVEPGAVIICSSDISCYNLFYTNLIEHVRPDVTILTKNNLYRKYFLDKNPAFYPFLYQENPYFFANLTAWNAAKRPTYLTNPDVYYIKYIGLDGDPFFLKPTGYAFQVLSTLPDTLPPPATTVSDLLLTLPPAKDPWNQGLADYFANIHSFSGMLAAKLKHPDIAKAHFEYALSLRPTYSEPTAWLTRLAGLKATDLYHQDPSQTFAAHFAAATKASASGNLEMAYTQALTATYLKPEDTTVRHFIADLLKRGNYQPQARLELQQILVFNPQDQAAKDTLTSL